MTLDGAREGVIGADDSSVELALIEFSGAIALSGSSCSLDIISEGLLCSCIFCQFIGVILEARLRVSAADIPSNSSDCSIGDSVEAHSSDTDNPHFGAESTA